MTSVYDQRGAKAAQVEAAVTALTTAVTRPNPTERAISSRLNEAKRVMMEYGDKHFLLLHRMKDNAEVLGELKGADALLRESFLQAEDDAEAALNRFQIAARPAAPNIEAAMALQTQEADGMKDGVVERLTALNLHMEDLRIRGDPISQEEHSAKQRLVDGLKEEVDEVKKAQGRLTSFVKEKKPDEALERLKSEQETAKELNLLLDETRILIGRLTIEALQVNQVPQVQADLLQPPRLERAPNPLYMYQKEEIPKFHGGIREYPSWRKEWKDFIIPARGEDWSLKSIDKYTPKTIDLQNCKTLAEALAELDAKYADSVNVSGTLVEDFVKYSTKASGDESRLVELKAEVMRLYSDLKAVKQEGQLVSNAWLLSQVAQKMPIQMQKDFSKIKTGRLAPHRI